MEITRRRVYVHEPKESWWVALLAFIAALYVEPVTQETRVHYSGSFGNTTQDMKSYDSLTTAEHDSIGAFYGGHYV